MELTFSYNAMLQGLFIWHSMNSEIKVPQQLENESKLIVFFFFLIYPWCMATTKIHTSFKLSLKIDLSLICLRFELKVKFCI